MAPDLGFLRVLSKRNLDTALSLMRGSKILIIDSSLIAILDLISHMQFLRDHGAVKIVTLESGEPSPLSDDGKKCTQALYFIRSNLISAKLVCDQINSAKSRLRPGEELSMTYGVIVVPRQLHIITALFESEGIYELVKFGQYSYDLIPLDDHILSLQYDNIVTNFWLHHDTSYLPSVAQALFNLRGIYGEFQHLIAIGPYSNSVVKLMNEFEVIYKNSFPSKRGPSEIPTLILMDRSLDFVSPFLTPLTYEAMLDDIFGIRGKTITFDFNVTGKDGSVKYTLDSSDEVFERARNLHFSTVVSQLLAESKKLRDAKEQCTSGSMDVQKMKEFVEKKLKSFQRYQKTLGIHLGALDVIIKAKANHIKKQMDLEDNIINNSGHKEVYSYLEDSMAKGADPVSILRLLALITLAQDGVKECRSIKTQFIQSYGYNHLATLHGLEKMDLLYPFRGMEANAKGVAQVLTKVVTNSAGSSISSTNSVTTGTTGKPYSSSFQTILKKLMPPQNLEVSLDIPDHSSYVYNGKYTALIAKLVEEILQALSSPKSNPMLIEKKLEELMKFYLIHDNFIRVSLTGNEAYGRGKNVLVFVIGGITRGEIAALQHIGKKDGFNFNVICGGTDITSGKKIMQELMAS